MLDHCTWTKRAVRRPSPRAMRSATSTSKPRTRDGLAGSASTNGAPPSASPPHTSACGAGAWAARLRRRLKTGQVAAISTVHVDKGFGSTNPNFTSAPLRHHLVMLAPDALAVLADVREQRALLLIEHRGHVDVGVRKEPFRLTAGVYLEKVQERSSRAATHPGADCQDARDL